MALITKKMDLFTAPENSIIIHASNAQGVWDSGIAKIFHKEYPSAFEQYHQICNYNDVVGKFLIFPFSGGDKNHNHQVATLVTSENYGGKVDSPKVILKNTKAALKDMMTFSAFKEGLITTVYSNKFNSGLFNVPWEDTEKLLTKFCNKYKINWIVCDPNLGEKNVTT